MYNSAVIGPATSEEKYQLRQLMSKMRELSDAKPSSKKIVRQTAHTYEGYSIASWKCTEYLYKKDPCPLPTQARGFFTTGEGDEETVAARGYNKFFNVSEVKNTNWSSITANTQGPYELTVKENGCLILAAALDGGKTLLVTSKHAVNVPHAQVGMEWMKRHLAKANKTPEEFAGVLHENNATAVFELCDDGFEEHILEYPERTRGLYLHGINRNAVELDTWPSAEVTKVAEEYGFHVTKYFTFDTIKEGKAFADKVRNDHVLDGRAIEGFVVRCKTVAGNRPFMFKIKYDEPYLMFREWREVTNRIISDKPYKTTYPLTKQYVSWVKKEIASHPEDFENFGNQKGIIGARKRFLYYYQMHGGSETDVFDQASGNKKTLIVPIATIGCGKTTVALVLAKLFGFGHVQNDNITAKNPRVAFHKTILNQFDDHSFVIADRNNHLSALRRTLTTAIREELPTCRIVSLYWMHDNASETEILKRTMTRVIERGDSHQSLTPKRTPGFRGIMRDFVTNFAPLDLESADDALIEEVIELDPLADSAENVRTTINGLCNMFPGELEQPSEQQIDEALQEAFDFKPSVHKVIRNTKSKKPAFIGLVPTSVDVKEWIDEQMQNRNDVEWGACKKLLDTGGYDRTYHITLAHIQAAKKNSEKKVVYDSYVDVLGEGASPKGVEAECTADYIVCNKDVMALRVRSMKVKDSSTLPHAILRAGRQRGETGSSANTNDSKAELIATNAIPHITLCVGKNAKAAQANDMLDAVFGPANATSPQNCPCGWMVIPVTLSFNAKLQKFMS